MNNQENKTPVTNDAAEFDRQAKHDILQLLGIARISADNKARLVMLIGEMIDKRSEQPAIRNFFIKLQAAVEKIDIAEEAAEVPDEQ